MRQASKRIPESAKKTVRYPKCRISVRCKNIRLSSDAANPLSRSHNQRADGDGCVGLHAAAAGSMK
jgi:hypothetical protein